MLHGPSFFPYSDLQLVRQAADHHGCTVRLTDAKDCGFELFFEGGSVVEVQLILFGFDAVLVQFDGGSFFLLFFEFVDQPGVFLLRNSCMFGILLHPDDCFYGDCSCDREEMACEGDFSSLVVSEDGHVEVRLYFLLHYKRIMSLRSDTTYIAIIASNPQNNRIRSLAADGTTDTIERYR